MTANEKAARLRSIDIAEEAQLVVIWSCFSTEDQKEAAARELRNLRAERREVNETEVIENMPESNFVVVFTAMAADPVIYDRESQKSVARLYARRLGGKEEARDVAEEICQLLERRRKEAV